MNPFDASTICKILLVLFSLLSSVVNSEDENYGKTFLEDVTMTSEEKQMLDKFVQRVSFRLRVPYMREELFLVRWLRARNFNLDEAEKMLSDHLKWWDETKMDAIEDEDWSDMSRDFTISEDPEDKEGRPVLYFNLGRWDIRRAAITGKIERLFRYICMKLEKGASKARQRGTEKKNVSQFILLINSDQFNVVNHGCLQCASLILRIVTAYENHFPGYLNKLMVVNCPTAALVIVDAARRIFQPETNRIFRVYGRNKGQWEPVLNKYFNTSQIPVDLGGSNVLEGLDLDY